MTGLAVVVGLLDVDCQIVVDRARIGLLRRCFDQRLGMRAAAVVDGHDPAVRGREFVASCSVVTKNSSKWEEKVKRKV